MIFTYTFIDFSTSDVNLMFSYGADILTQLNPFILPIIVTGVSLTAILVIIRYITQSKN